VSRLLSEPTSRLSGSSLHSNAIGSLPDDWLSALGEAAFPAELESIDARLAEDQARGTVYPPAADVFAAFRLTPFASVRAVILGQDPYHRPGQAHGLAFSVPDSCAPLPPSLRNIRAELLSDVGLPSPPSGSLVPWARHGVLLLNTALTVREGTPGSHGGGLWSPVVDGVLAVIAAKPDPVAFLLWGRRAHDRGRGIDSERHPHVLSAHPSPLSAHRGFLGSRPFSRANAALVARGAAPIDWSLG
jgi:uracil-DNA glycosylase